MVYWYLLYYYVIFCKNYIVIYVYCGYIVFGCFKKIKYNILVFFLLLIIRLIYIKQNLMNRLSVSDDFYRLIIFWGVNEVFYYFFMGLDLFKCFNFKVFREKKNILWEEVYKVFWDFSIVVYMYFVVVVI